MAKTLLHRDGLSPSTLLRVIYDEHPDWRGTPVGEMFEDPLVTVQFSPDAIIVWHPEGTDLSALVAQARELEAGSPQ